MVTKIGGVRNVNEGTAAVEGVVKLTGWVRGTKTCWKKILILWVVMFSKHF